MAWWEALVLGVVQGLTEFFPVSSSGHLVLTEELLGLTIPGIAFDVALHVATLLSVLIVYRTRIAELARGVFVRGQKGSWPYLLTLALASLPAAVIGLLFEDWFEARFNDSLFAGTMILVTGSFVWSSRWARTGLRGPLELLPLLVAAAVSLVAGTLAPFLAVLAVEALLMGAARLSATSEWVPQPGWSGALFMGVAQAVAILPGISRSGSTVVTGIWRRIDPVAAAEFSFLMSVPAILGAALLSLPDMRGGAEGVTGLPLAIGAVAAAASGIAAIQFFVRLLRRQNFHAFAYYCWLAGSLFILSR
jgi:undecaprenyl-diphosphatase